MSTNITFECEECGMIFSSKLELNMNSKQEHPKYKYVNKNSLKD
jgi:hypothetical protein